jgi:pimeloyl-ACP methyl ester carboxylesterase
MSSETIKHPMLSYFSRATPFFASRVDQRFSYCLYIPQRQPGDPDRYPLIVVQHGTARTAARYRDSFREFCDTHRCAMMAPLFPACIGGPDDLHNFKFLARDGLRYDQILLGIVAEVAERFPVSGERFVLYGFSGGGQFAHRFLYLHPERLEALTIGAPGRITQLDDSLPWWLGTKGMAEIFGQVPDLDAIRAVEIQMVVGGDDTETWEINNPGDANWMDGVELTGDTRIERLHTLERNFAANGISARFDVVPGVGHSGIGVRAAVDPFIADVLARLAAGQPAK